MTVKSKINLNESSLIYANAQLLYITQVFFGRKSRAIAQEVHRMNVSTPKNSLERYRFLLKNICHLSLLTIVVYKSVPVVANMLNHGQSMNRSFDTWRIVNTYGAFGSVTKRRVEVILEGTNDDPASETAQWLQYEFKCKPGDIDQRPCLISPYHYRLDWQMWFAGFQTIENHTWIIHLLYKFLNKDPLALSLIRKDPFQEGPKFVRAVKYEYEYLSMPKERSSLLGKADEEGEWWRRRFLHEYFPPFALNDSRIINYLEQLGYLSPPAN